MRIQPLVILTACVLAVGARAAAPAADARDIRDAQGTIKAVSAQQGWYAIVPDGQPGTRYAPSGLPERFKRDGLRVVFSGRVGDIPPRTSGCGARRSR